MPKRDIGSRTRIADPATVRWLLQRKAVGEWDSSPREARLPVALYQEAPAAKRDRERREQAEAWGREQLEHEELWRRIRAAPLPRLLSAVIEGWRTVSEPCTAEVTITWLGEGSVTIQCGARWCHDHHGTV